jgi:hypothetical protein
MTEREQSVNRDLRILDEAHRLGRITRDDYRARRRRVIGVLCDSNGVITARKSLLAEEQVTARPGSGARGAGPASLPARPSFAWKAVAGLGASLLLIVVLVYLLLRNM